MVYDLRHLGIDPATVSFNELVLIIQMLVQDPTSWLQASINKWRHPVSFEWIVAANHLDAVVQMNTRKGTKPNKTPKPWPERGEKRFGNSRADAKEILKRSRDGDLTWQSKRMPT